MYFEPKLLSGLFLNPLKEIKIKLSEKKNYGYDMVLTFLHNKLYSKLKIPVILPDFKKHFSSPE